MFKLLLATQLKAFGLSDEQIKTALDFGGCFLKGTSILMADGTNKEIQEIEVGDLVMSFNAFDDDEICNLKPRRVSRKFISETTQIIDLHGIKCTPGHVFLTCDENEPKKLYFSKIGDVLKRDGIIIRDDGSKVRARTAAKFDSGEDAQVNILICDPISHKETQISVRAGIPLNIKLKNDETENCLYYKGSLFDYLSLNGLEILKNGSVKDKMGNRYNFIDWPGNVNPSQSPETANWVAKIDSNAYVPEWITGLASDENEKVTAYN